MAVDVDEVLGQFLHSLNIFLAERLDMHFEVADYYVYIFAHVWGVSPERSNELVHAFFESEHFAKGVPPLPGARESLTRLTQVHGFDCQVGGSVGSGRVAKWW